MNIVEAPDAGALAHLAADYFQQFLERENNPLVTLPTGLTPLPFYRELRNRYDGGHTGLGGFTYLALDEYQGLPAPDRRRFGAWIAHEVLDPLGVPPQNRIFFHSDAADPGAEIARFREYYAGRGPLDLAVLGLGGNGHVGFNEPGSAFDSSIRQVALAPETMEANAAYWDGSKSIPAQGYTLGLAELHAARHTVLLVSGESKAGILRRVLNGPVSEDVPATYLHDMENVTILADAAALRAA